MPIEKVPTASLQTIGATPGETLNKYLLGSNSDEEAEEEVNEAIEANQGTGLKHRLSNLSTGQRESQDAYLSVWRQKVDQSGGKKIEVTEEAVKSGDQELREHRFIVTSANYTNSEKFSVRSTFGGGPEIAHSFGKKPRMWQFSGILRRGTPAESLNDMADNWWQALEAFYKERLRATLLMRNNEFIRFRIGKLSIRGYITSFVTKQSSQNDDAMAQFNFSMYVRSYRFTDGYEYTPSSQKLAADRPVFGEEGTPVDEAPGDLIDSTQGIPTDPSSDNIA
jgi:hypothetical protein